MNYYEHHIGDYDADTSHLSWTEDLAYTRLIRLYYRKEKPIPVDLSEACRLIRATSREQKKAVESVLTEFFILREDGWHQDRCDEEIAAYQAGEPEREAKKANEETRLKRHRAERAELFKALTAAGQSAPWNTNIKELRELVNALRKQQPETPPATAPETQAETPATKTAMASATPATATHTPIPTTHTQSYSVPDGTGGKPPNKSPEEMTRDELWAAGKSLLKQAGMPDSQCGSFVGKLVKDYQAAIVIVAVRTAVVERPADPASFLKATCQRLKGERKTAKATANPAFDQGMEAAAIAKQQIFGGNHAGQ